MALIVAFVPRLFRGREKKHHHAGLIVGSVIAEAFMVAGYWLYEAVAIGEGFAVAFAGVSSNVFQGIAGIAGSFFLISVLSHTGAVRAYGLGGFAGGSAE
jgi:hypothetical protein